MRKSIVEKMEKLVTLSDCEMCFAVPDGHTIIDSINPATGRSWFQDETLEEIQARYPGAQAMRIVDFCAAKAKRQDRPVLWVEVSEKDYDEMFCVLPPAVTVRGGFMVGEAADHHAGTGQPRYQAYRIQGGKHYAANRPMQVSEFRQAVKTPIENAAIIPS